MQCSYYLLGYLTFDKIQWKGETVCRSEIYLCDEKIENNGGNQELTLKATPLISIRAGPEKVNSGGDNASLTGLLIAFPSQTKLANGRTYHKECRSLYPLLKTSVSRYTVIPKSKASEMLRTHDRI